MGTPEPYASHGELRSLAEMRTVAMERRHALARRLDAWRVFALCTAWPRLRQQLRATAASDQERETIEDLDELVRAALEQLHADRVGVRLSRRYQRLHEEQVRPQDLAA